MSHALHTLAALAHLDISTAAPPCIIMRALNVVHVAVATTEWCSTIPMHLWPRDYIYAQRIRTTIYSAAEDSITNIPRAHREWLAATQSALDWQKHHQHPVYATGFYFNTKAFFDQLLPDDQSLRQNIMARIESELKQLYPHPYQLF